MKYRGKLTFLASLVAASLLSTPSQSEPEWIVFDAPDASFRVEMPGPPTSESRERWFPLSRFRSQVYKAHQEGDVYGVNHTDIPGAILFVTPDKTILNATREGFLESSNARELSFGPAQSDGRPGWSLRYAIPETESSPAQVGTAQMLFVGRRLFIFYTEVDPQTPESASQRYFESIRIPAP